MLLRIVGSEDDDDNDESILVRGDNDDAGCYWGLALVKMMVMMGDAGDDDDAGCY